MTKTFKRGFAVESLTSHFNNHQSLIGALLDRWVLPGDPGDLDCGEVPLRLAVRDSYLNLYANGQSVAKISAPGGKPRLDVHWKYVGGIRKAPTRKLNEGNTYRHEGKTYRPFSGDALSDNAAVHIVAGWIDTAMTYAGDEKKFVEHLVARNANVIDLEMGLPGDPNFVSCKPEKQGKAGLFAPRMDVVVIVPDAASTAVHFWEAKLASNDELRARTLIDQPEHQPHVCYQLTDYTTWMKAHSNAVASAYSTAVETLKALAEECGKTGDALTMWQTAKDTGWTVSPRPAIIVANYDPCGKTDTQANRSLSFGKHKARLEALDWHVREVSGRECRHADLSGAIRGGAN